MPALREQLEFVRTEALDFFAHPEDRSRGENTRRKLAHVMTEISSVIQGAPLLGPTAPSSHQQNTRQMASALSLKRYECWPQSITYDEDTPIGRREAGESEDDISVAEAEGIFLEAFRNTIALLDLAEPTKTDTPRPATLPESKDRKRGPKPDYETAARVAEIVAKVAPDGDWRRKLDDVVEALDEASIPCPKKWRTRDRTCQGWVDYDEKPHAIKAIEYRLDLAKRRSKAAPETLS